MNGTSSGKNSGHKECRSKGESIDNLPAELRDDAYDLDRNGRWEQVYYDGRYRKLWRPTAVAAGWQPFTGGRWTVWYGDNVWIPEEPFGYVTHHYGNWVYVNSAWYWAPPVKSQGRHDRPIPLLVSRTGLMDPFGRTMSAGSRLRPPRRITPITIGDRGAASSEQEQAADGIGISRLAYAGHAVVVPRGSLYSVNSYTGVRVASINRTTIVTTTGLRRSSATGSCPITARFATASSIM